MALQLLYIIIENQSLEKSFLKVVASINNANFSLETLYYTL